MPPHQALFHSDGVLWTFLLMLCWNLYPPNLSIPSSYDYRHERKVPNTYRWFLNVIIQFLALISAVLHTYPPVSSESRLHCSMPWPLIRLRIDGLLFHSHAKDSLAWYSARESRVFALQTSVDAASWPFQKGHGVSWVLFLCKWSMAYTWILVGLLSFLLIIHKFC
jgi:hypothetical protein